MNLVTLWILLDLSNGSATKRYFWCFRSRSSARKHRKMQHFGLDKGNAYLSEPIKMICDRKHAMRFMRMKKRLFKWEDEK